MNPSVSPLSPAIQRVTTLGSVDILKFIPSFPRKRESIGRKVNKSKMLLTNSVIGFPLSRE